MIGQGTKAISAIWRGEPGHAWNSSSGARTNHRGDRTNTNKPFDYAGFNGMARELFGLPKADTIAPPTRPPASESDEGEPVPSPILSGAEFLDS